MVGSELAHDVAMEVFDASEVDRSLAKLNIPRGLVDGLFGAAKTAITNTG